MTSVHRSGTLRHPGRDTGEARNPVENNSTAPTPHLRSKARKLGFTIRQQRGSRAAGSPLFSVIDRETGQVIDTDILPVDLRARLWSIVRDRRRARENPGVVFELPEELCPSCGSQRLSFFRFCRTCGLDFEATIKPPPVRAPEVSWLPERGASDASPSSPLPRPLTSVRESRFSRLAGRIYDIGSAFRFASPFEIAGWAILGLLIGLVITIVATRS